MTLLQRLQRRTLLVTALALLVAARTFTAATPDPGQLERLARVRVSFVENRDQPSSPVAFSAPTFFGTFFVTRDGKLVYSLPPAREGHNAGRRQGQAAGWALTETLVSGRPLPSRGARAVTGVSYFHGNDTRLWQSMPTYEEIRMGEVWQGVSVSLRAHGDSVEKIFTLLPGARVDKVRLRVDGATSLRIDPEGTLVAGTGNGEVRFAAPEAYQERDGGSHFVSVAYVLEKSTYGFRLGRYDPALPVIIDPLLQSTYLGGSNGDGISAIAINPTSGEVIVAGATQSTNFPGVAGGAQSVYGGGGDGFIARLDSRLTTLLQATYLGGGNGDDEPFRIAIHPSSGEVIVTGYTTSTNFPGTAGGAQPAYGGGFSDGFVARFNPTLTTLLKATYLGGSSDDFAYAIAVHPTSGEIIVAGSTRSANLPGTAGGAQPALGGGVVSSDAFVARLDPTLTTLLQATYLGGSNHDEIDCIVVPHSSDEILVAGETDSVDFPGTARGAQTAFGGGSDSFVARLNSRLTTLLQATYLGGSGLDFIKDITVHPSSGEVLVAGTTYSFDFPGTAGGAQPAFGGGGPNGTDGFVARFDPTLTTLLQATYLGGSSDDGVSGILVHPSSGEVLVVGVTFSTDFRGVAGGAQPVFGGGNYDGFVARLTADLDGSRIPSILPPRPSAPRLVPFRP